ncbi:Fcf2-domain-containing protein [Xylariomycetidae sp. FL0641]|nr:Fcf2-domain-containing protein [Xylariomycetidae sp. FL0641]
MAAAMGTLSDEQIDQLLKDAETRLASKQQDSSNGESLAVAPQSGALKTIEGDASTPNTHSSKKSTEKDLSVRVPQPRKSKKEMATKADAGAGWFNLPKTNLTPELRRDLQVLRMRDVLDPKRHYKKDNARAIPEFSQVGTVVAGPTDFYTARMTKKERKRTLLEEVLENEDTTRRFKSKYGEIQAAKTSGKKGHYKKMMQKRYGRSSRNG